MLIYKLRRSVEMACECDFGMLEAESSLMQIHGGVHRCSSTNSADTLDSVEVV